MLNALPIWLNKLLNEGDKESMENWKHFQKFQDDLNSTLAAQSDVPENEQNIRVYVHYKALDNTRDPADPLTDIVTNGNTTNGSDNGIVHNGDVKRHTSGMQRGQKVTVFVVIGHRGLRAEAVMKKESVVSPPTSEETETTR